MCRVLNKRHRTCAHVPAESLHVVFECLFVIGSRRIVVPCIPVQHLTSVSLEISHTEHFDMYSQIPIISEMEACIAIKTSGMESALVGLCGDQYTLGRAGATGTAGTAMAVPVFEEGKNLATKRLEWPGYELTLRARIYMHLRFIVAAGRQVKQLNRNFDVMASFKKEDVHDVPDQAFCFPFLVAS